jgi:hypothetical protein
VSAFQLGEKVSYFFGVVSFPFRDCAAFWACIRAIIDMFGRHGLSAFGFRGLGFDYLMRRETKHAIQCAVDRSSIPCHAGFHSGMLLSHLCGFHGSA